MTLSHTTTISSRCQGWRQLKIPDPDPGEWTRAEGEKE